MIRPYCFLRLGLVNKLHSAQNVIYLQALKYQAKKNPRFIYFLNFFRHSLSYRHNNKT